MNWKANLLIVLAAVLAGSGGVLAGRWWFGDKQVGIAIGETLPAFSMPTLDGVMLGPQDLPGRTLLINFWAPWCAPCMREIPLFRRLRQEFGPQQLEVLGIALDDPEQVRRTVEELAIDYPIVLAAMSDYTLMRALGNSRDALPFSVLIDRDGRVRARKLGEYHEDELRAAIGALAD